jgi:hypothetical protein
MPDRSDPVWVIDEGVPSFLASDDNGIVAIPDQGRIADRGTEAQQFRTSGLSLVIVVTVDWNSAYIADAVAHLRATCGVVPQALVAHTTPLGWEHIGLSGDFLWNHAATTAANRRTLHVGHNRAAA